MQFQSNSLQDFPLSSNPCNLCPRLCGTDRSTQTGYCQSGNQLKAARAALHFWEEPCISGSRGSGTIFFSGCTLRCCYCQNYRISSEGFGREISAARLAEICLELQAQGAHNINLVTASHYLEPVIAALDMIKDELRIPVVYNNSGYERVEVVRQLKDYVGIFLPDFKYYSDELAWKYSRARDYFTTAAAAISAMIEQTGATLFDGDGIMQKGVIIRHLVLPGAAGDSRRLLQWISENLPPGKFMLSLMSQYTPAYKSSEHHEINRRVTTLEYEKVVEEAIRLGLTDGFMQERSSAKAEYTPPFDLEGI
ncbi:MAG TPA: radical SAM protein [Syntrophomonas sp.]|nr:radical SAM protein [Syntrophomonas sp.]